MNTTSTPAAPQFSDAAVALWTLQNDAAVALALATMGERVTADRFVARQRQAAAVQTQFAEAVAAASPEVLEEYTALLRWRHANGMR